MTDNEWDEKRFHLQMQLLRLWNDFRVPQYKVAEAVKLDKTHFSHMLAGRREFLLRRKYDEIVAVIKAIRDENEGVTA